MQSTNIPNDIVTFLFAETENSAELTSRFGNEFSKILNDCLSVFETEMESHNGFIFQNLSETPVCAFSNSCDSIKAAVSCMKKFSIEMPLGLRIGIHKGNAEWNGKDYMGYVTLARTQRIMSASHFGQILVSEDAYADAITSPVITSLLARNELIFKDCGERFLKDLIQPIKIYQVYAPPMTSDFPDLKTLDSKPNNLPIQLSNFIGREDEIAEIKKIISEKRLVTLLGPGGTGKTRLSLQLGADLIDVFRNGVIITEFSILKDPSAIIPAIAKSFGILEQPGKSIEETLISYLKEKEVLIIFDDCESFIHECSLTAEKLLRSIPKLKIIATSRETLKCTGEHIHKVKPLAIPATGENVSPAELIKYESVRLFVERALSVNTGFRITNENASAVAGICRDLDGIPLALELAASKLSAMTVERIHDRLSNRFMFLTGGKRTALPRQQTLKALIDWSYDLLSENEKKLWKRLCVFSGEFTLQSAEKVCSDELLDEFEIIDILESLVEKSIAMNVEKMDRFKLLDSMWYYGRKKLEEEDELQKIQTNHLNYYLQLSNEAETKFRGPDENKFLDMLQSENSNFLSAFEFALNNDFIEEGLKMATSLGRYWMIRCQITDSNRIYEKLFKMSDGVSKSVLAKAYLNASSMANMERNKEKMKLYIEKSLMLYKEIGDELGIAYALNGRAILEYDNHDYLKANSIFEQSLSIARKVNDKYSIAFFSGNLGDSLIFLEEFEKASMCINESMSIYREQGNRRGIAYSLQGLGYIEMEKKDFEKAISFFEDSYELYKQVGDRNRSSEVLTAMIECELRKGNKPRADTLFGECKSIMEDINDKEGIARIEELFAESK